MSNISHARKMLEHQLEVIAEECRSAEERIACVLNSDADPLLMARVRKVQQHVGKAKLMALRMKREVRAEEEADKLAT